MTRPTNVKYWQDIQGADDSCYPGSAERLSIGSSFGRVFGDTDRADNQLHYPLHPLRNQEIAKLHWTDAPPRPLGEHDGLSDRLRESDGPFWNGD